MKSDIEAWRLVLHYGQLGVVGEIVPIYRPDPSAEPRNQNLKHCFKAL